MTHRDLSLIAKSAVHVAAADVMERCVLRSKIAVCEPNWAGDDDLAYILALSVLTA